MTKKITLALCSLLLTYSAIAQNIIDGYDKDRPKSVIKYINPNAPAANAPTFKGKYYEDFVPDTLDIAQRAELAISAMTNATNPAADYEMYFYLTVFRNPPVIMQDFSSWCQVKYMEAMPLLRLATGSKLNLVVDKTWTNVLIKSLGPDGLFYYPFYDRPWFHQDLSRWYPVACTSDGKTINPNDPSITQFTHPFPNGRLMGLMTIYYLHDKNPIWKKRIEKMIDSSAKLAIYKDDYAYYPRALLMPNSKMDANLPMPVGMWAEECGGRLIQGLSQYYNVSKYEPARQLAEKLVKYLRYHGEYFDPETAAYRCEADLNMGSNFGGHFHAHTIGLLSILEYAMAVNDKELKDYVNKGYLWGRNHPESSALLGYFPEWLGTNYPSTESCEISDMIALAVKLSLAGYDYWDDVERWTRNHFAESQLTQYQWIYKLAESQPKKEVASNESSDHPAERNIGGFAGWSTPNDWIYRHNYHDFAIMHCCTGNAARTLFYIWENIFGFDKGNLTINLLMNRASQYADIYSYIPYEGRIDIKIKENLKNMSIRMPEWIQTNSKDVVCKIKNDQTLFTWSGKYINLCNLKKGQMLTITFPISETVVKQKLAGTDYTFGVKGNTVISVEPTGKYCPLYQRDQYRQSQTKWRKIQRFVPDETIEW